MESTVLPDPGEVHDDGGKKNGERMKRRSELVRVRDVRQLVGAVEVELNSAFVKMQKPIRAVLLAFLTKNNYLLIGDPGCGKTALADCAAQHFAGAKHFSELMGSFTTEDVVFGAIDIAAFRAGHVRRVIDDGQRPRLAAVEFAMLDEVFKANDGVLNAMLKALNERQYQGESIPLRTCGAATNWPEIESRSEKVAALYDRFLLRCIVEDLSDKTDVVGVLEAIEKVAGYQPRTLVTLDELDRAGAEIANVVIGKPIREIMHDIRARLESEKVKVSLRRLGRLQDVMRASAWLRGSAEVGIDDFESLSFGLWTDKAEQIKCDAILNTLDQQIVQKLVKQIDQARSAYRDAKRNSSRIPSIIATAIVNDMKVVVTEVQRVKSSSMLTKRGRDEIASAMRGLEADFKALKSDSGIG